jgi:uncharacterized FAD-dependent dehydrogenase
VIVIGTGPAGLFAAVNGLKPIVVERGERHTWRRRDLKAINVDHVVNEDSNYCFGEGGAGTYSDGKLYTDARVGLLAYGATPDILVEAHPHIGTISYPKLFRIFGRKLSNVEGRNSSDGYCSEK